jgi:hypothetical protein
MDTDFHSTTEQPDQVRLCLLTCSFTLFCGTAVGFLLGLAASLLLAASSLFIGPPESVAEARASLKRELLGANVCAGSLGGVEGARAGVGGVGVGGGGAGSGSVAMLKSRCARTWQGLGASHVPRGDARPFQGRDV